MKTNYLVIRKRDDSPPEAWPFEDLESAALLWDEKQAQWSECYLCEVMDGHTTVAEVRMDMFKVKPITPSSGGLYECHKYIIRTANSAGGKAGRGYNRTSTLQVTEPYRSDGYLLKKQYRFNVGDRKSYDSAMDKCVQWIKDEYIKNGGKL